MPNPWGTGALINNSVYIISTQYLKNNSTVPLNLDDAYLNRAILEAQNIDVQRLLGSSLYTRIITDISGNTLAGEYKVLVDEWITPALLYYSIWRSLTQIYMKIMNTSVVLKKENEMSGSVEYKMVEKLKEQYLDIAEFYATRMKNFLLSESSRGGYYEYNNIVADVNSIIPEKGQQYNNSGFFFSKRQNNQYFGKKDRFGNIEHPDYLTERRRNQR